MAAPPRQGRRASWQRAVLDFLFPPRCVGCRPHAVPPLAVSVDDVTASLRLGGSAV